MGRVGFVMLVTGLQLMSRCAEGTMVIRKDLVPHSESRDSICRIALNLNSGVTRVESILCPLCSNVGPHVHTFILSIRHTDASMS